MSSGLPRTSGAATSWLGYKFCISRSRSANWAIRPQKFYFNKKAVNWIHTTGARVGSSPSSGAMTGVVGSLDIHIHISSRGTRIFPCFSLCLVSKWHSNHDSVCCLGAWLGWYFLGSYHNVLEILRISTRSIAIFVLVSLSMEYWKPVFYTTLFFYTSWMPL
jgi:hypothetical protein